MFDDLPIWARPAARVGFFCFASAAVLFSSAGLLVIVFAQWAVQHVAIVLALCVAGGVAWSGTMLSVTVIGFKMTTHRVS